MKNAAQKRSKILIIVVSVVLGILAVGGIAVAFMLNYNTHAPKTPLVLNDGQNIFISTEMNDNYKGYRFKFTDEADNEIIIDSENNQLSVDELLEKEIVLGKTYKISTCYLAENIGNNSEYSDSITWKCQKYLEMPTLNFNNESSILSWNSVEGADFYRIYISGEEDYIETIKNFYDLQLIDGGEKTINVVGYSNNENLLTSNKSNTIQLTLIHYLKPFTSIDFNSETKIITAKSDSNYQKVNIHLGQQVFESTMFSVAKSGDEYIYTIDITTVYNNEEMIGISPCDIDEYNIFSGSVVYYTAESAE